MATWQSMNYDQSIPDVSRDFTITCPKGTDIYDKPPNTHRFDAPVLYTSTTASKFRSASVTISADWTFKYDQGGLCLVLNLKNGMRKWIKAGIEFLEDTPLISVVTKDRWADWSLRPLLDPKLRSARIQVENTGDGNLWVYVVGDDGRKHPVREVTWWGELDADTEVLVGPAAAKPSTESGDLLVSFSDLKLDVA